MQEKTFVMKKIILTGDRPTGKTSYRPLRRFASQTESSFKNSGEYDEIYIMLADAQALTDNFDHPEKVKENALEVALDNLAVGVDPKKSHMLVQSQVPALFELCYLLHEPRDVARVQRNPTVKSEIKMRGFQSSVPLGFFSYPVSQAADITAFDATTVPVGEDQAPMLEICREIVQRFNTIYGNTLVMPEILLPESKASLRLPGTDGKAKMSKSLGNCIYLSDDQKTVHDKVMSMYTDPNHLRVSDPGNVEGNPVFIYLDAFATQEHVDEYLKITIRWTR